MQGGLEGGGALSAATPDWMRGQRPLTPSLVGHTDSNGKKKLSAPVASLRPLMLVTGLLLQRGSGSPSRLLAIPFSLRFIPGREAEPPSARGFPEAVRARAPEPACWVRVPDLNCLFDFRQVT